MIIMCDCSHIFKKIVLLETGGHIDISDVPDKVIKIVDVKCPGSGESERNLWENLDRLKAHDEVKFVIRDRSDYDFAKQVLKRHHLEERCAAVLFSPVHSVLPPKLLTDWSLEDQLPVRLQIQLHKYVWGEHVRGV